MSVPSTMAELEQRCWVLAGERMIQEPLAAVIAGAEPLAARLLRAVVHDPDDAVMSFFAGEPAEVRELLGPEGWAAIADEFLRWAGASAVEGADDWVEAIDGLAEPPPLDPRALGPWLLKHGVRRRLSDALKLAETLTSSHAVRFDVSCAGSRTIEDALYGRVSSRSPASAIRDAARSYLSWAAGRLRLRRAREELWESSPDERSLRECAGRLRALLAQLDRADAPALPVPAAGALFAPSADALALELRVMRPHPVAAQVHLLETDSRGCAVSRGAPTHVRLVAEHALDAVLDPEHALHASIRAALERPRWAHLLADIDRDVLPWEPAVALPEGERLVFRVDDAEGSVSAGAAVQKRKKRGGWTAGRTIPSDQLLRLEESLDARDLAVARALADGYGGYTDPGEALIALVGHPRVFRGDRAGVPVRVRRVGLDVRFVEQHGDLHLSFRLGDTILTPEALLAAAVEPRHAAFFEPPGDVLSVAEVPEPVTALADVWTRWSTGLPPEADEALLVLLERLPASVGRELPPRLRGEARAPERRLVVRLEPLPGGGLAATLVARPLDGASAHAPGEGPRFLLGRDGGARVHVERDLGAEREAAARLEAALGLDAGVPFGAHAWRLDEPEAALDLVGRIQANAQDVIAEWPEDAAPWRVVGRASASALKVTARGLGEWLALGADLALDEGRVTLARILAALRERRRYVALGKGKFAAIEDELRAQLAPLADLVFERDGELAASVAALAAIEAALPAEVLQADAGWREARARLAAASSLEVSVPAELDARLRDYQREGVRWLLRLASWAPGAVLADDMGLGKTVQALAMVRERAALGPALVVAPTSLAETWRRECERFTPSLEPMIYRGQNRRERLDRLAPGALVITSYDILARDVEALAAVEWSSRVFDEAHALKNPEAQRSKAAGSLRGGFALALTGTPLENHLGELWSLVSIVLPGLLGPWSHFRARFAVPIERDGDLRARERLRALLRPFLLRRTKSAVAPELPPRVEVVRPVELSAEERALYEAERREAIEKLTAGGGEDARFAVLAALTRLRRLACHPALVHPDSAVSSTKLAEALALAEDLAGEGHRALVFSQFTSHLRLVRDGLEARGHRLLYLDGATPAASRAALVDRWQGGEGDFFLISLKAGGTGLNLTAADTVIHLDPWWNPAVEDQASDRTHRIGQDKPVTVVRLVAQDTIEQTVLSLHETKRELARGILEGAEASAKLSTDELLTLLQA
ncbi:MAG: DEAD/DEAH box helicase [Sandaracinaceae bacterium]|nr:DEAD/DEAH box helicase [Sandaracinaceae bacterium]